MNSNIIIKQTPTEMSTRKYEAYLKWCEIIQWGRKNPISFVEHFFGIYLMDFQKYVFMNSWGTPFCLWAMNRSAGKAVTLDTKVYVSTKDRGEKENRYNVTKTIGELKIGDKIFGDDGKLTEVIHLNPIIFEEVYEVEFEDGEVIEANSSHLWSVYDKSFMQRRERQTCLRNTDFLYSKFLIERTDGNKEYRFHIPLCKPLQYAKSHNLQIDPYILGYWLGDGTSSASHITCAESDISDLIENTKNKISYFKTKKDKSRNNCFLFIFDLEKDFKENGCSKMSSKKRSFLNKIREMNLYKNKHIPNEYLYASVEQRLELLQGLMDSDGYVDKSGRCSFSQTNYNLISQVSQLLSSLGIKNNITKKENINYVKKDGTKAFTYIIHFSASKEMAVFKLKRKYDRLLDKSSDISQTKAIVDVRKTKIKKPMRCITVGNNTGLFICGGKHTVTHNSFLSAPFIMAKSMLFPSHKTYLLASTASQSQETFKKIEKTAKKEITSITGGTDIFAMELVRSNSQSDGFTHKDGRYSCELFNGSEITSLSGAYDRLRGIRSNLNFYDESGFTPNELFIATEPFLTQNASAKYGSEEDQVANLLAPKSLPNQRILASSASSVDTHFFAMYKEYSMQMFMGNPNYFVADINCDMVLAPTMKGKPVTPLIDQETIDLAMRQNPEKAMREYKNIFTKDGGDSQPIKRAMIVRNSHKYLPIFYNDDRSLFVLAFDPARSYDNSIVLVGKIYLDENVGYKMDIINCVSFSDIMKKKRTPIRTPEQIDYIKKMMLDYNGKMSADYENIHSLSIDSGSGGGGVTIADYLMEDWYDASGNFHRGLIDSEESKEELYNFPDAIDKLKLLSPKKYKTVMYDALIEMLSLDLISFPLEYDGKEFFITDNDKEEIHMLSQDEKDAFVQIDFLKEELVNIYRFDGTNGGYRYDLSPDKENKMHDDRAYCMAMLGYALHTIRRDNVINPKRTLEDDFKLLEGYAMLF